MRILTAIGFLVLVSRVAHADVQDWQVNEVLTSAGGDTGVRYVELRNDVGGCLFASSRIEVFDADGGLIANAAPFASTTCFGPNTYFLFATSGAETAFATTSDHGIVPTLPVSAGQVCFTSSASRYDCVRYGTINTVVADFFGPADTTSAAAPNDGNALIRIQTSHVVVDDWDVNLPTPRGPNDGTPWTPPDAGPMPDAAPIADAAPPVDGPVLVDAFAFRDAPIPADADGQRFLDADPVGGADCGCRNSRPAGGEIALTLLVLAMLVRRRTRA